MIFFDYGIIMGYVKFMKGKIVFPNFTIHQLTKQDLPGHLPENFSKIKVL